MSEEKLTVAELMARAGREVPAADKTRRRRRRSLDEGGISVADLTDGFSRIEADGPRRGAHAADDNEDDEQETSATETAAEDTEAVAQAEAAAAAEAEAVAQAEAEERAAAEAEAVAQAEAEERAAQEAEAEALAAREAEAEALAAQEAEAAAIAEAEASAAEPTQQEGFAAGVPQAVPVNPVPSFGGYSDEEVTYTFTAFLDSETATTEVADPGPTAREMLDGFSAVDDVAPVPVPGFDPVTVADSEVEPDESAELEQPSPAEFDYEQTSVIPLIDESSEAAVDEEFDVVETVEVIDDDVDPIHDAEPEFVEVEETVDEYVEKPDDALLAEPEHRYEREARDQAAYADVDEDNSLSVPLLVLQVFVGVIAGVFLFMLFAMLWSGLPKFAMVLIGLVVTGAFVLVANKLRRASDRLTPILAGVVGLALTFGPFFIQLM